MRINDLKAEFSCAYVRAVAHSAEYFVQEANRMFDADGIDLTMLARSADGMVRSPRLDMQVKATAQPVAEDFFPFDLGVKNYDELRSEELQVPRILVVVIVPEDIDRWVSATETELTMRHCGYWLSLRGQPATNNMTAVRVRIPRASCFRVDTVREMMERIKGGGVP